MEEGTAAAILWAVMEEGIQWDTAVDIRWEVMEEVGFSVDRLLKTLKILLPPFSRT